MFHSYDLLRKSSGSGSWSLAHQTSYLPICGPPTLSHRALTLFAVPFLHSSEKVRNSRVETFRGVGIYQPASTLQSRNLSSLFLYVFRIHRYTSSRRVKCAGLTPTRWTHTQDSRTCDTSSRACTSLSRHLAIVKKILKCAQLTTSHHAFQRPYLNGDPASSHNHPRVNNWCVPSFSSLLVSEHAHTHRLQQTYAGGPPCAMKVPPVPRCAPERDV